MPQTRWQWFVLTAVVTMLGILWIGATRVPAGAVNPTGRHPSPDLGHPAPDFALSTPDGDTIALSDFRGQPVVLNFWATWCPPCRAEIPALQAASAALEGQAIILGVDVQESAATVSNFISGVEMTYPVVLDTSAEVAKTYRVRAFPTTYLIDSQGVVVEIFAGPVNEPLLLSRISELMGD